MLKKLISNINRRYLAAFLILIFTVAAAVSYYRSDSSFYRSYDIIPNLDSIPLNSGEVIQQELVINDSIEQIKAIDVVFDIHDQVNLGHMTIGLYSDDSLVQEWSFGAEDIGVDGNHILVLDDVHQVNKLSKYSIRCTEEYAGNNGVSLTGVYAKCPYQSGLQRSVLSGLVLLSGMIIAVLFCISSTNLSDNRYRIMLIISTAVMCVYSVMFEHSDGLVITRWGLKLLDCSFAGNIRHYMHYLMGSTVNIRFLPNYNIAANIMTAIAVLPLYIIQKAADIDFGIYNLQIYDCFRKISLVISIFITARYLKKIVLLSGGDKFQSDIISLLYCLSPVVLLGNLAMGQIDCIVVMFVVLGMYHIIKQSFPVGMLMLGISMTIKIFPLFFFVTPVICVYIGCKKKEMIKSLFCLFIPLIITKLLSTFFFLDYGKYQSLSGRQWGQIGKLFYEVRGGNSLFEMSFFIIGVLILVLSRKYDKDRNRLLVFGCLSVTTSFLMFMSNNPQWLVYPLIALMFAMTYCKKLDIAIPVYLCGSIGMVGFAVCLYVNNVDLNMIDTGLLGSALDYTTSINFIHIFEHYVPSIAPYISVSMKTLVTSSLILACIGIIKPPELMTEPRNDRICLAGVSVMLLFDLAFVIMSVVGYFDLLLI